MPIHEAYAKYLTPAQIECGLLQLARELLYCDIDDFVDNTNPTLDMIHKTELVNGVRRPIIVGNMEVLSQMSREKSCPTLMEYVNNHFPNSVYGLYTEMFHLFQAHTKFHYTKANFGRFSLWGTPCYEPENFYTNTLYLKGADWEIIHFSASDYEVLKTKIENHMHKKIVNVIASANIPYLGRVSTSNLWVAPSEDPNYLNQLIFIFPQHKITDPACSYLRMTYNKIKGIEKGK